MGNGVDDADLSTHPWSWWVYYLAVVRVEGVVGVVLVGDCWSVTVGP